MRRQGAEGPGRRAHQLGQKANTADGQHSRWATQQIARTADATPEGWVASCQGGRILMKFGQFTLRAGMTLVLWGVLGLGLLRANAETARAADNAFVRVVHAATVDEHVDVFLNNGAQPLLTGFTFSNVTDYATL